LPDTKRSVLRVAVACAVYVVAAWFSGLTTMPPTAAVLFRPPNALLLGLALIDMPRWWLYVLATLPANPSLYSGQRPFLTMAGYLVANASEVAVGAWVVWRALGRRAPRFDRIADCAVYIAGAAVFASFVSATLGAAARATAAEPGNFIDAWRPWFLGDAIGNIVIGPAIIVGARASWKPFSTRLGERALVASALVGVTAIVLSGAVGSISRYPGLVYAPLPFLLWTAVRFGVLENALSMLTVCVMVLGTALAHAGAYADLSPSDVALSVPMLLIMLAIPLMFLAGTAEQQRRTSTLFGIAFQMSPSAITITSVPDGRFLEVNKSFEQLSGYARNEILGKTTENAGIWGSQAERRQFIAKLRDQGFLRDEPITLRTKTGEVRHVLFSGKVVELDDTEAVLSMARDVTDEMRATQDRADFDAQMQQTQRLEAIGQLAGGVAHDFNNVLQAIKGYTELAADELAADHPVLAQLDQVNRAADRAATFTSRLLTFSRRDAPRSERLDLNKVVSEIAVILRRILGEHVQVGIVAGRDLAVIEADPGQVEQIVMNLCINARDVMPSGGIITIETGNAELTADDCRRKAWARVGRWTYLRVADQGPGIAEDVLPHIFEPFFTTKPVGRGTGLGLSTVYAIVERHGGLIAVDSVAGHGATFTVYFPALEGAVEAPEPTPTLGRVALAGNGETILLAEDEPLVRDLAVEMLEAANYRVLVACDGAEAETIIRERGGEIEAAILDVVMPLRSGRQVYDTLHASRPELPVLFCSGYSFGELTDVQELAGTSVLSKPYSRTALLSSLRGVLEAKR
jgi:PAS domain S-box-containing protein